MNELLAFGPEQDIPIDSSVIDKSKDINIKDIFHALTELITNSDDAYVDQIREGAVQQAGAINIGVFRNRGGKGFLVVSDEAGGMSEQNLVDALRFSGETSAYHRRRKSTRGLFGQGLKEASIALGTGLVLTSQRGILRGAKILPSKKLSYIEPISTSSRSPSGALKPIAHDAVARVLNEFGIDLLGPSQCASPGLVSLIERVSHKHNGTTVLISIENDRFRIPKLSTLRTHLIRKPQLRYVFADPDRTIELCFLDQRCPNELQCEQLRISLPDNLTRVYSDGVQVQGLGHQVTMSLYESPSSLDEWDAGIFFTCFGRVVIDHQVWLEDLGDATFFFTGTVDVSAYLIPELERRSYKLLPSTRQGLDWVARENRRVKDAVMEVLRLHVNRKQKELESRRGTVSKEVKKSLLKVLNEMNAILEELESELDPKEPNAVDVDRQDVFIKPEYASVKPGIPRKLSVYVPVSLEPEIGSSVAVTCSNSHFVVMDECTLKKHSKYPERFYSGTFRLLCHQEGEEGLVLVKFKQQTASARCVAKEPTHRDPPGELSDSPRKKRGVFTAIEAEGKESPYQRFHFDKETGILKIFTEFPRTGEYIGANFSRAMGPKATKEGSVLLSELVCDAIARVHVYERIESTQKREEGVAVENTAYSYCREADKIKMRFLDRVYAVLTEVEAPFV